MAKEERHVAYPEWTEYRKKSGRDPLGMQTSSIGIYQTLLPGISNVTLRVRYYGLYAWLCRTYAQRLGETDPKSWQRFIRRAEALYALVAHRHGGEGGIASIEWATKKLRAATSTIIDFSADAEPGSDTHYLKQAWGAYGAAYASQLFEVGIFAVAEGHDIPVPGEQVGGAMASTFADALGPFGEEFYRAIQLGRVTLEELDALASITPSEIKTDSPERDWYEKILFAQAGLERPADQARRKTLLLILFLTAQLGRVPTVSEIRWMLYTGCDSSADKLDFGSPELADHRGRWWVYQANDYTHVAYETLLKFVLDLLELSPAGRTLESLIAEAVALLIEAADDWPSNWIHFLRLVATDDPHVEDKSSTEAMRAARQDGKCTAAGAWAALRLLAIVHTRSRVAAQAIRQELRDLDPIHVPIDVDGNSFLGVARR